MSKARENILAHLRKQRSTVSESPAVYLPQHNWSQNEKIKRLTERMEAVRTEVHQLSDGDWISWLNDELPKRNLTSVLVGQNETGDTFSKKAGSTIKVQKYEQEIEHWKQELFQTIDVGITTTRGGIAETGSLILWPDSAEPRLMSLVPPVHIALLEANTLYETFAEAMHEQSWAREMPTNALLISGPSKTADIEQTLAYGIHGPKQLIVLILGK